MSYEGSFVGLVFLGFHSPSIPIPQQTLSAKNDAVGTLRKGAYDRPLGPERSRLCQERGRLGRERSRIRLKRGCIHRKGLYGGRQGLYGG